jgi:phosphohistidine swiveling domain-containing protein
VRFRSLDELTPADESRVGGKAWNCARLKQHGFPVPDGLAIPADAADADLPAIDRDPWLDRWPPGERFAVRSSGIGEDAPEQSFAGIHETHLNVGRASIIEAVAACRASAHSERARTYRRARGLTIESNTAGVLIQRMIHPFAAGVAFTVDPLTGAADEVVINSTSGLATALVDGHIDPDEIRVRKADNAILFCRAGADVDSAASRPSLSSSQTQELAGLLTRIERHYGAPQDVEWCYDGAQFWIVQSRPITVAPSSAALGCGTEWTRANLAEVLPELTSPQALSVFAQILNTAERRYLGRLMAPEHVLGPMVKPFYGRLYFNLSQLRRVCLMGGTAPADMLRSLGHPGDIHPEDEQVRRPPVREWIACLPDFVRLLSRHLRAETLMRAHERTVAAYVATLSSVDPRMLRDDQIWAEMLAWQRTGTEWIEIVLLFGGVLIYETALRKICGRVGVPFEPVLYSHLAAGEKSVSAQQAFDLVALARVARAEPRASEWLRQPERQRPELRTALHGTAFLAAFDQFLDRYGHRGLYESDWALPRYAEDPEPLLQALRLHLVGTDGRQADVDPALVSGCTEAEATAVRAALESRMTGLRRWTLRPRARRLLARIKQYYLWREQCRSDMIRVVAIVRRWHLVLAQRFVERDWLDRREDYFLLRLEEIAPAIENHARATTLRDIVAARSAEMDRYRRIQMPLLMHESELHRLIRAAGFGDRDESDCELRGVPVSRGLVEGEVVVIDDPGDFARMKRGAILVTRATDPSWTPLFTLASGVIVEVGGVLSHASTVAREFGIPALANVRRATRRLRTGDRVLLNATEGFVRKLSSAN